MELWARVFARVSQGPIDAIDYSGPDRDEKTGTAARWYLGLPQLMLRDNSRSAARRNAAIKGRLIAFLSCDFKVLTQLWRNGFDKAASRDHTPRQRASTR